MAKADSKAAKKIAEKKAKIAAKCGKKAAKCAAVLALLAVFAGCATSDPSSRSTSGEYGDTEAKNEIVINGSNNTVNLNQRYTNGDAAVASADSAGSTETTTATPTNTTDIKPQTDVNTTGGRTAGVLESIVGAFGTWLATPSGKEAAAKCEGGNCAPCSDGNCTTGACSDCTP